ncbi:hypothetical protein [Nitrosococcus wardiae]|uniref:Uncharacterized protein n=1 Tax=Nitrosococcus wardiae TaxID=1814290 RepID=A0A4P7C0U2_9GAMM|nr:hypothetical protein [Nitrosococcus wardiae]QBQ54356.1 hypothetical protein E3U44_07415 [Nitrosococcus wardiae]
MNVAKISKPPLVFALVVALGMGPVSFAAQTSTEEIPREEVEREVEEAAQALKTYSAEQRDEAVKEVKGALEDLDARIDRLEAKIKEQWDQMKPAARQKARATLETLRQQRYKVAAWSERLKQSSAEAWEEMKKGFSKAYTTLLESWEEAEQELDRAPPE